MRRKTKRIFIGIYLLFCITLLTFYVNDLLIDAIGNYRIVFLDDPCIKPYQKYFYKTCTQITVKVNHEYIRIPQNFNTDLASIPQWLWSFLPPQHAGFVMPAILHDYLYLCPSNLSRKQIDDIFYSTLRKEGVIKFTAFEMWLFVRIFGSEYFNDGFICKPKSIHLQRYDIN